METENDALQRRQEPVAICVDQGPDGGDSNCQEGAVPAMIHVHIARAFRIVEDEETLDQSAAEEADTGEGRLPTQDGQPTYGIVSPMLIDREPSSHVPVR